jgi:hypothetical protein
MGFATNIKRLISGKTHANPTGQGSYSNSKVLAFFRFPLRFLFASVTFSHSGREASFTPHEVRGKKSTPRQPSVGYV